MHQCGMLAQWNNQYHLKWKHKESYTRLHPPLAWGWEAAWVTFSLPLSGGLPTNSLYGQADDSEGSHTNSQLPVPLCHGLLLSTWGVLPGQLSSVTASWGIGLYIDKGTVGTAPRQEASPPLMFCFLLAFASKGLLRLAWGEEFLCDDDDFRRSAMTAIIRTQLI